MLPVSASGSVRKILEERFATLLSEMEEILSARISSSVESELQHRSEVLQAEGRDRARFELGNQLNQAARRIRHSTDAEQVGTRLLEAAGPFVSGAAMFRMENSVAHLQGARGVPAERLARFSKLEIPLQEAAALSEAVTSRDPVTALAARSEISAELAELGGHTGNERVAVYPVVAGQRVPAVLYTWGAVEGSIVELLTLLAGATIQTFSQPADLVQISASEPAQRGKWNGLSAEEQPIHLSAQRAARVRVAELLLQEHETVERARAQKRLYGALRERIDQARQDFRKDYFIATPTMVDYLHLELVRTLANDDSESLGEEYPGPLA